MPNDKKPSAGILGSARAFVRMWRAFGKKRYRTFPWRTVAAFVISLVYLFDPFDFVPDYIPLVGYIDDAAVLGLLAWAFKHDVGKYIDWETALPTAPEQKTITDQGDKP